MLRAERVSLMYDEVETTYAVRDVSCEINKGEFIGLVGPSGSGKSSLLYLLSSFKRPTEGTIWLDDRKLLAVSATEIAHLRMSQFGFVFQHHFLVPHLTAVENILLGVSAITPQVLASSQDLIRLLEIEQCAHKYPGQMSGGQRQRVAVARALVQSPRIVFADEPTSAVDRRTTEIVMAALRCRSETLIVCTHDLDTVSGADRWFVMRDGRLNAGKPGIMDGAGGTEEARQPGALVSTPIVRGIREG